MEIEKSVKQTFLSEKVCSFSPTKERTFLKPVIDLKGTGAQIKRLRKIGGYSVHDLQMIFGFDYPQAIYAWDRERRLQAGKMLRWSILSESPSSYAAKAGKNIPTIDNLLVLSELFGVEISQIIVTRSIEISFMEKSA